jgi:hypothetical protein
MAWHGMAWRGRRAFVCDVTDSKRAAGCWLVMALFVCFCVVCAYSVLCVTFTFVIPVAFYYGGSR